MPPYSPTKSSNASVKSASSSSNNLNSSTVVLYYRPIIERNSFNARGNNGCNNDETLINHGTNSECVMILSACGPKLNLTETNSTIPITKSPSKNPITAPSILST